MEPTQQVIPNKPEEQGNTVDFLSVVAHELKNPLSALIGYLSLFTKDTISSLNEEQKMLLNRVNISAKQLASLIENLLNSSRIERGVLQLNLEEANLPDLVKEVVDEYSLLAQERKINLSFVPPPGNVPSVKVDKTKIVEVISNFLSNAINYTKSPGVIKVSIDAGPEEIITHVQDSGIGIAKESLLKLFNKFYRAEINKSEKPSGMGLGLYISKTIIEMHEGKIWAESTLGQGSTFSFSLPVEKNI